MLARKIGHELGGKAVSCLFGFTADENSKTSPRMSLQNRLLRRHLGPVDKLIDPEAGGGDMYEAEIAC